MPLHRRRHPEFDAAQLYAYPQHLREAIAAIPAAPGVYIFHGEENDVPLYIGKCVNLRSRLLARLRNPEEARLLRQTQRINHIQTVGEIGACCWRSAADQKQHPLLGKSCGATASCARCLPAISRPKSSIPKT